MNLLKTAISGCIVAMAVGFSACKHEPELPLNYLALNDSICFESNVKIIIQTNCATKGCHDGNGEKRRLMEYSDIVRDVNAGNPNKSKLYQVITASGISGNRMPPKKQMNNDNITAIELWIMEGAKDTKCDGGPCDSTNVTFATIQKIVDLHCKGCHVSGTSANTTLFLTTYNEIKAAQTNKFLLDHIQNLNGKSSMPPAGYAPLSICNIAQFKKWITDGMPQ